MDLLFFFQFLNELNDNSSGFHINVNYSGDDINGNWLDRVDFVYSIDSDNINEKLIADGNWRPVTVPVVMRNSDAVGIWFNVGVAEYSFWDANYSEEIEINVNIDTVSLLFDDPYNMLEYMDGVVDYKVLSGTIREVGAKAEI